MLLCPPFTNHPECSLEHCQARGALDLLLPNRKLRCRLWCVGYLPPSSAAR